MSRALRFTLLLGVQISWVLAFLYALNVAAPLDGWIAHALGFHTDGAGAPRGYSLLEYLAILTLAFGVTWTTVDLRAPLTKWLIAGIALVEVFTLAALLSLFGIYFSPIMPALATALAVASGVFYSRSATGRRQKLVLATFDKRISSTAAQALTDGRAAFKHFEPGQEQEVTVLTGEIVNHEALLDVAGPAEYVRLCNQFFRLAAAAVVEKGGCLIACDGEGFRAVFGVPLPAGNHATVGCRAALEIARRAHTLSESVAARYDGIGCDVRLGVNSGDVVVGRFGADQWLGGFGIAGEEVDFARRLCAANLIYGSMILIGARTYELAEADIEARPLELLRRRGSEGWLEVYELLGEPHELTPDDIARRDLFWTGVIFFREKRLAEASEKFLQARAVTKRPDGPLDFYTRRIQELQHPPAAMDWETTRIMNSL